MAEVDDTQSSIFSKQERGVLYVGEKKYAVGLTWLAFDLEPNNNILRQRLSKFQADYFCTRQTIANQQGFGYIKKGHKPKMIAAASIAADTLIGDWHGVFVAENGWWYVAVHSDNISPGGDQFFLTEEEAFNCFTEQANLYNWPRSYAPATWNIEHANPDIPLDKLLDEETHAPKLRAATFDAIFGGKQRRNFILFIMTILIGVLLSVAVLPKLAAKAKMERDRAVRSTMVVPAVIKAPPKLVTVDAAQTSDGFSIAQPSKVFEYCSDGFSAIIEPLPGWQLTNVVCEVLYGQNTVRSNIQWKRNVGSLDLVKGYLQRFSPKIDIVYNGSDSINGRFISGDLSKTNQNVRVSKRAKQIRTLYDRFGGLGKLSVSDVFPKQPEPQSANLDRLINSSPSKVEPPYLKMTLLTTTAPDVLSSYFDVPGLKLKEITWQVQKKSWTYRAEILFQSPQFFNYYELEPYNE